MNNLSLFKPFLAGALALATCSTSLLAADPADLTAPPEPAELNDEMSKVSYGIGMNLGMQWRDQEVNVDPDILLRGMKDAMRGGPTLMTEEEMRNTLSSYQSAHRARLTEKRRALGEQNRVEGEAFLEKNKNLPGVVALPSGLQYKVIQEGQGDHPKATDLVTVHYRGTLIDGTEFDSSYQRGQPASFNLSNVIAAWTEGVQLMKPGAKYQLFAPPTLAYGERGSGPRIGPNATLIFEVELISFTSPPPPPTPDPVTSDIIKVPSKEEMDKGAKIEVIKKEDLDKLLKEQQKQSPPKE
jgi:FKBP-type peptidyl-prolyl cis-trans isomerase FklB